MSSSLPALFIGRFQPFHIGHLHVLKDILSKHEEVILALGSTQKSHTMVNPLTAEERKEILWSVLRDEGLDEHFDKIYEVPDINDDERWVKHLEAIVPEFGSAYSGSDFVRNLFEKSGEHEAVKVDFLDGVSATMIREMVVNDEDISDLVAQATYEYLKQIDFEDRLKKCLEPGVKKG